MPISPNQPPLFFIGSTAVSGEPVAFIDPVAADEWARTHPGCFTVNADAVSADLHLRAQTFFADRHAACWAPENLTCKVTGTYCNDDGAAF